MKIHYFKMKKNDNTLIYIFNAILDDEFCNDSMCV